MSAGRTARRGVVVALLLGLLLATALISYQGLSTMEQAVSGVGWGIGALVAFRLVPIMAGGFAWSAVLKDHWRGRVATLALLRWIRDSINLLLPVAQVGGDIVGVRLLIHRGASAGAAGASVLVDKTLETVAQILFLGMGAGFLLIRNASSEFAEAAIVAFLVAAAATGAFLVVQRLGFVRWIERLLRQGAKALGRDGAAFSDLNEIAMACYRDPRRWLPGVAFHLAGWMAGIGEMWMIASFLGHPVTMGDALIIASISQIINSAAFMVPAAVGVQEAGCMATAVLVGLSPETGLALSLVKRLRQLAVGVPALLVWQVMEGRRFCHNPI